MAQIWHLIRSAARRGPRFLIVYLTESLFWDLRHGTRTHLRVPKPNEEDDGERRDGLLYVASLTSVVRKALDVTRSHWGGDRFERAQFIDLGCGKGKALLVYALDHGAAGRPAAVGIEYDADLARLAEENVRRLGSKPGRVEVHCDSAVNLERYVGDGDLIVYLYNSFQGETLQKVLEVLSKRSHILIYVDPVERDALTQFGYEVLSDHQGRYNADTWLVAEHG